MNSISFCAPIAIYDSGVGGLAIAKSIKQLLPRESLHYIGDTKRLPYGEKTVEELLGYVDQVTNFCLYNRYKLLVIACHTATAAIYANVPHYFKGIYLSMGLINVIDPLITFLLTDNPYKHIGLIATSYTIASDIYPRKLQAADLSLTSLATPLLAPMVENSWADGKVDINPLYGYLNQLPCHTLDAFIPACTHYIFLEKYIHKFFKKYTKKEVKIMNTAWLTALTVKQFLSSHNLLNNWEQKSPDRFMATRLTPAFIKGSKELFGQEVIELDLAPFSSLKTDIYPMATKNWII